MRRRLVLALVASFAAASIVVATRPTPAALVVEKVVGIVGDQSILLSELHQRERPFLVRIYTNVPKVQQDVAIAEMRQELLDKLIEERLVAISAEKLNISVSTKEIDDAIKLKAADAKSTTDALVADAARQGLSESDYREEARREILFGKMLETRVRSRVRPTEDDARDYYKSVQVQERKQQGSYRASIIVLDLPKGPGSEAARALADSIVKQARAGGDFAALARKYSVDASRYSGGDKGSLAIGNFTKSIDEAILRVDPKEISEPLVMGDKLMIVKVTERPPSAIPPYVELREPIFARIRDNMLQKQIKVWLNELRQGVYIEKRL